MLGTGGVCGAAWARSMAPGAAARPPSSTAPAHGASPKAKQTRSPTVRTSTKIRCIGSLPEGSDSLNPESLRAVACATVRPPRKGVSQSQRNMRSISWFQTFDRKVRRRVCGDPESYVLPPSVRQLPRPSGRQYGTRQCTATHHTFFSRRWSEGIRLLFTMVVIIVPVVAELPDVAIHPLETMIVGAEFIDGHQSLCALESKVAGAEGELEFRLGWQPIAVRVGAVSTCAWSVML